VNVLSNAIQTIQNELYKNFIVDDRWMFFVKGLGTTLMISFFAIILGLVLGMIAAACKMSNFRNIRIRIRFGKKQWVAPMWMCKVIEAIGVVIRWLANVYIDVIRGTPTMVQILIINFIIFASVNVDRSIVAIIAFGINSGAYVAEIIRGGILSVNKGQTEAGRSLGLSATATMVHIVMPQAIKNIMPALSNELIVLVKETAVIGYIAKIDFTAMALKVQSVTYDYITPLLTIAVGYYVVLKLLAWGLNSIEKALRKSDVR